jgi:hypothetical protein
MDKVGVTAVASRGELVTTYYQLSSTMRYAAAAESLKELHQRVTGNEWVKGGNRKFDPTKRIWYPGYERPLVSPAAEQTAEVDMRYDIETHARKD